jgi:hypothetical protein
MGGPGNNDTAFTPLDRELALASHWVSMTEEKKQMSEKKRISNDTSEKSE